MAQCPECEAVIDVDEDQIEEGQTVDCPDCGAAFEVVNTNPLELELIPDDESEGESGW